MPENYSGEGSPEDEHASEMVDFLEQNFEEPYQSKEYTLADKAIEYKNNAVQIFENALKSGELRARIVAAPTFEGCVIIAMDEVEKDHPGLFENGILKYEDLQLDLTIQLRTLIWEVIKQNELLTKAVTTYDAGVERLQGKEVGDLELMETISRLDPRIRPEDLRVVHIFKDKNGKDISYIFDIDDELKSLELFEGKFARYIVRFPTRDIKTGEVYLEQPDILLLLRDAEADEIGAQLKNLSEAERSDLGIEGMAEMYKGHQEASQFAIYHDGEWLSDAEGDK
jgi:hypothetical protein